MKVCGGKNGIKKTVVEAFIFYKPVFKTYIAHFSIKLSYIQKKEIKIICELSVLKSFKISSLSFHKNLNKVCLK